jgi:hypothetical protein
MKNQHKVMKLNCKTLKILISKSLKLEILEIYENLKKLQDDKEEALKKIKEKEIKTKELYISDMEKRLENQISSLLKEKNQIETQYSLNIENKEKRQKELENQLVESLCFHSFTPISN